MCVSPLTGSVLHNVAYGLPLGNWTHVARLTLTCINYYQRNSILLVISSKCKLIFWVWIFIQILWIAQVAHQVRQDTSEFLNTNLFWYILSYYDTYYHTRHGLDLKYLLFASAHILLNHQPQCSSISSSTSEKWEVRIWNLGGIIKAHLNTVIIYSSRLNSKIFFLCTFSTQCSSSTQQAGHRSQKSETENEILDRAFSIALWTLGQ